MRILPTIAALGALLLASSSLQADLIESASINYSLAGTISHGGGDIRSDSASDNDFGNTGFEIGGGPDGLTYFLGGMGSLNYDADWASLGMLVNHRIESPGRYPSTFITNFTVSLTLGSAADVQFSFSSLPLTGNFSGTSSVTLDGVSVVNGEIVRLDAGMHIFSFSLNGGNTGWDYDNTSFNVQADLIAAVPEPGTWVLLAGGMVAAWGVTRRKLV